MKPVLYVCETCRFSKHQEEYDGKRGGQLLFESVVRLAGQNADRDKFVIKPTRCLMGCERHCNVHLRSPGKIGYVIGRFEPNDESAAAILEYFLKYIESETGQVPYKQWPQGVKGHFIARIPPWEDDYGDENRSVVNNA